MTEPYRNPGSQAERAAMLKNDRRNNTLAGRTASEIELESRGRFGARQPQIIGENAPTYPKAADWVGQDNGQEPPLGIDVNAVPVVGEAFEVQASIAKANVSAEAASNSAGATAPDPAPSDCSSSRADVERPGADPIPRRPIHFEP